MKKFFKPAMAIIIVALSVLISLSTFLLPSVAPKTASPDVFSAERAMPHVQRIATAIHPIGSPEQEIAGNYIMQALRAMGLTPQTQSGHVENGVKDILGYVPYSGEAKNIYARLEGTGDGNQAILMLAHYDSTLAGPGAADDASSVAVLLETARALLSGAPLQNDIIFLFADGEEANLLGSALFAKDMDISDVSLVMNFEARGNRGPSILFETSNGNEWLMNEFKKAAPDPVAYSITFDIYKMVTNVTDFTSFLHAGKSGFNLANLGGVETYHMPEDTPENLSREFLQHQGNYALSLARHFGNIPLDPVKSSNNAVYFTLAKGLMVLYPAAWTVPFTIFALLLFAAVLFFGLRRRLVTLKGIIAGFLMSLLTFVGAAAFGIAAQILFTNIYFKLDTVLNIADLVHLKRTIVLQGYVWIAASFLLSLGIVFAIQRPYLRKKRGYDLFIGSSITWAILSVFSAFYLPGAQYMFLWPLIVSFIGMLLECTLAKRARQKNLVLFTLSTAVCILMYVPIGYLLFQGLMMQGAGIPIAILSFPASLMMLSAALFAGKTNAGIKEATDASTV